MKKSLLLLTFLFLFCGIVYSAPKFVVVIDAGHGGKDPGAIRGKIKEKDINLGVALALGGLIEKNMKDVKVVYTRKTDVFVELKERAKIANQAKANLFISIHTNSTAAQSTTLSGTDTYILGLTRSAENLEVAKRENSVILLEDDYTARYEGFDPNSPESYIIFEFMTNKYMEQSLEFASCIQKGVKDVAKRADRGVRQAGFLVLRESSMPSALIELGFINNIEESNYLITKAGQKNYANAIYSGFKNYKANFDRKQGIITPTSTSDQPLPSVNKRSEYRVQFLYSPTELPANSPLFKGLSPVSYYQDNGFKYTYGASSDLNEIVKVQTYVRGLFPDAFVVQFLKEEEAEKKPKPSRKTVINEPTLRPQIQQPETKLERKDYEDMIEYRVQFLYSKEKLSQNSLKLKGLSPVDYYEDNGYKYTYGSTTDQNQIIRTLKQVSAKFPDAFVIRLKNGKRIK